MRGMTEVEKSFAVVFHASEAEPLTVFS